MKIICTSRFRGEADNGELFDFMPGQEVNVTEDVAAHLLHRCPGSFELPVTVEPPEPEPKPDTSAMSTETATGLTTLDRRARGGKRRKR